MVDTQQCPTKQCMYLGPDVILLVAGTDSTPLLSVAVTETLYVVPARRVVKSQLVKASSVGPAAGQVVVIKPPWLSKVRV